MDCKYWSQQKFIHLCMLVRYSHFHQYDPNYVKLFAPLIKELKMLSTEGLELTVNEKSYRFLVGLATVSADNLSAHSLGGFQQHFVSGRICRFCMADREDIGHLFRVAECRLRTKDIHDYHLEALQTGEANGSIYGVRHRCPLLDLPYFDVTSAFPPDIMHDCLEGILPHLMHRVLQKACRQYGATVEILNERLNAASIGYGDRLNLFTAKTITPSGSIVGSASQKWRLFLLLPRIIGDYLQEDVAWQIYLCMRDITDIVFASVVCKSSLSHLEGLIVVFLSKYAQEYGEKSLTPKFHYLVHYPSMLAKLGPLRPLWCMRYEGKHQYFKAIMTSIGNFINVTSTMSRRHQMRQCLEFSSSDVLCVAPYAVLGTKVWSYITLPAELRLTISEKFDVEIDDQELITTTSHLRNDHVHYKLNSCIVLSVQETENIPVCLKIKYIVNFRGTLILCGRLLIIKDCACVVDTIVIYTHFLLT